MVRALALASLALFSVACEQEEEVAAEVHDHDDHEHMDHTDLDLATEKMTDGGTFMVAYSTMPAEIPLNEDFMVMVALSDMNGAPALSTEVSVDATMPEHGHGMNQVPMMMDMGNGMWHAEGMRFHMEGYWQLEVVVNGELATFDIACCGDSVDSM